LALTSPTSGGRSVGVVRWRSNAPEFLSDEIRNIYIYIFIYLTAIGLLPGGNVYKRTYIQPYKEFLWRSHFEDERDITTNLQLVHADVDCFVTSQIHSCNEILSRSAEPVSSATYYLPVAV
jgi:hypothetical protein